MAKRNVTLHDKYKSTTALYPKIDAKSLTPTAIEEITKITEIVVEEQVVPNPTLAGTEAELTGIQIGDTKYKVPEGGGGTDFPLIELESSQITFQPTQYHFTEEQFNIIINNSLVYIKVGTLGEKDLYTVSGGGGFSSLNLTRIRKDSATYAFIAGIVVDLTTMVGTYYSSILQHRLYQHNIDMTYNDPLNWSAEKIIIRIINDSSSSIDSVDKLKTYLYDKGLTSITKYLQVNGVYINKNNATDVYNIIGIYRDNTIIRAIGTKANDVNIYNQLSFDSGTFIDTVIAL